MLLFKIFCGGKISKPFVVYELKQTTKFVAKDTNPIIFMNDFMHVIDYFIFKICGSSKLWFL